MDKYCECGWIFSGDICSLCGFVDHDSIELMSTASSEDFCSFSFDDFSNFGDCNECYCNCCDGQSYCYYSAYITPIIITSEAFVAKSISRQSSVTSIKVEQSFKSESRHSYISFDTTEATSGKIDESPSSKQNEVVKESSNSESVIIATPEEGDETNSSPSSVTNVTSERSSGSERKRSRERSDTSNSRERCTKKSKVRKSRSKSKRREGRSRSKSYSRQRGRSRSKSCSRRRNRSRSKRRPCPKSRSRSKRKPRVKNSSHRKKRSGSKSSSSKSRSSRSSAKKAKAKKSRGKQRKTSSRSSSRPSSVQSAKLGEGSGSSSDKKKQGKTSSRSSSRPSSVQSAKLGEGSGSSSDKRKQGKADSRSSSRRSSVLSAKLGESASSTDKSANNLNSEKSRSRGRSIRVEKYTTFKTKSILCPNCDETYNVHDPSNVVEEARKAVEKAREAVSNALKRSNLEPSARVNSSSKAGMYKTDGMTRKPCYLRCADADTLNVVWSDINDPDTSSSNIDAEVDTLDIDFPYKL